MATMTGKLLDRRGFGRAAVAGLAAATTVALGAEVSAASSRQRVVVYRLASSWSKPVGKHGRTECGCRACRNHAENKIFFTRSAADTHRAHPGCHCQVEAIAIDGTLEALRRDSRNGVSVDRRHMRQISLT